MKNLLQNNELNQTELTQKLENSNDTTRKELKQLKQKNWIKIEGNNPKRIQPNYKKITRTLTQKTKKNQN